MAISAMIMDSISCLNHHAHLGSIVKTITPVVYVVVDSMTLFNARKIVQLFCSGTAAVCPIVTMVIIQ